MNEDVGSRCDHPGVRDDLASSMWDAEINACQWHDVIARAEEGDSDYREVRDYHLRMAERALNWMDQSRASRGREAVDARVQEVINAASKTHVSDDPLVKIAWTIQGLDLWHRSGGSVGHTPRKTVEYVTSQILRMPTATLGLTRDDPK